jgi:ParB family transcriptional regulator, chromosome partitioning protein
MKTPAPPSGLELPNLDAFDAPSRMHGERFFATLDLFEEDPSNPRTEREALDDPQWIAFVEDIRTHGILQPIVVRKVRDKLMVCFGARRLRAATQLQLTEIPYVLTDANTMSDYAQVSENERRKNLQPHELAAFIAKRIELGDKRPHIAKLLKMDDTQLSFLMSLHDAPPYLLGLYHAGKIRAPQAFAALRAAFVRATPAQCLWLHQRCDAQQILSRSIVELILTSMPTESASRDISTVLQKSAPTSLSLVMNPATVRRLARSAAAKTSVPGAALSELPSDRHEAIDLFGKYPLTLDGTPYQIEVSRDAVSVVNSTGRCFVLTKNKPTTLPSQQ